MNASHRDPGGIPFWGGSSLLVEGKLVGRLPGGMSCRAREDAAARGGSGWGEVRLVDGGARGGRQGGEGGHLHGSGMGRGGRGAFPMKSRIKKCGRNVMG